MIPDETGRYCNSCKKSVIDFTEKTDEEIQQFIINNFNQTLCGRFKNSQVNRIVVDLPENIFSIQMPLWMRFLVACLLIFGISLFPFETTIAGKTHIANAFYQEEPVKADSAAKKPRILKKKLKFSHAINYTRLRSIYIHSEPISLNTELVTLGGLGIQNQDNPIIKSISDLPENEILDVVFNEVSKETEQDKKSGPEKETPRPAPYLPTEFILPTLLSIRKETNGEPMD